MDIVRAVEYRHFLNRRSHVACGYKDKSNINIVESVTMEGILDSRNLMEAFKKVVRNQGASGVDGIPTVVDRLVQRAAAQVLEGYYDRKFSDNSYGFRSKRSCKDAITKACSYLNEGRPWIIDLDLCKFFDTVNYSKLLQVLSNEIKDGHVISLVHKILRAPVSDEGKVSKCITQGTPQGGSISPILVNILLNELDQVLDNKQIKFVRYADDMVLFCTSRKAVESTAENMVGHIVASMK